MRRSKLETVLRFIACQALVAVTSVLWLPVALLLLPWRVLRIKLGNYYGRTVGYAVVRIAGVRPVVRHAERLEGSFPAIYVANHTSVGDAFLSIWLCPVGGCGVMKREVAAIPGFGQLYWLSGHLLIDRSRPGKAVEALEQLGSFVRRQHLGIWIMPEGTSSRDGRLQPFKSGLVHLAIATGLPVVPVVIHGMHRVWPRHKMPSLGNATVEVDVGEPIDTSTWRAETHAEHAAAVHDYFVSVLSEDQRPLPTPKDSPARA